MKSAPVPFQHVLSNVASSFLLAICAVVLSACGGGSGGGGGGSTAVPADPSIREPLPQLVQDIEPVGPRVSMAGQLFFPNAVGDSWDYLYTENGAVKPGVNRSVSASTLAGFTIRTVQAGGIPDFQSYLRTGSGHVTVIPLSTFPLAAQTLIGNILEYPDPFYPINGVRVSIRQGSWGADLDGDGFNESFRFEFKQIYVGLETVATPSGSGSAAHLRSTIAITISPSNLSSPVVTVVTTQDEWWALNIGLVRRDVVTSTANGGVKTTSMQILSGTVGGVVLIPSPSPPPSPTPPPAPALDGALIKIDLLHKDLVYDRLRNLYYASIPGSVVGNGNRIAIIDPSSGSVSYSANPVGSDPSSLAIAQDGSALYVGLDGAGVVVKLSLPGMSELSRVQLPADGFFGQTYADRIAVSPIDPDVVATSLRYRGVSPSHGGVVLMRNEVLQPRQTQGHTGSNLIAFDANGQFLYGYNNETTEFGLRKIQVVADGLTELFVVSTGSGFGNVPLEFTAGGNVLLGNALWRSGDLQLTGTVSAPASGCKSINASRLICLDAAGYFSNGHVLVADANSFVTLMSLRYDAVPSFSLIATYLVTGPTGQIAIRNSNFSLFGLSSIWLFTSPSL